jgi:hypothetical protein
MFAIAHTLLYYETGFCEEHSDEAISQEQPEPPKKDCPELYEKSGEIASPPTGGSQNHFSSFSIRLKLRPLEQCIIMDQNISLMKTV